MQVSLKYAQEHLADLVSAANRGEDVEIAAPDQAPVRLLLVKPLSEPKPTTGKRILGAGRGEMRIPSEEEWAAMDDEIARQMNDGPLFPTEHP